MAKATELYHQDDRGLNQYKYGNLPYQKETIFQTQALYRIGKICQWKCEVFKGLNQPLKCGQWAIVPFFIFNFLIRDVNNIPSNDTELFEDILQRHVHSCLTYIMYDKGIYYKLSLIMCLI